MNDLQLNLPNVTAKYLRLTAKSGVHISNAKHDAVLACLLTRCEVVLEHNDTEYVVNYIDTLKIFREIRKGEKA